VETLAVEIKNLTKNFGKFIAVDNLSLNVRRGEYMGLLGPNGAGKSTTLKSITGLVRPSSGQIFIAGIDAVSCHREALAHVGCIIETPQFPSELSPVEVLETSARIYGLNKVETAIRARDVLEEVRMWEWRNKPIGGFSKGMRQRIALAQAMLPNPDTIILDEPTSGLDPRGMIEMRRTLNSIKNGERSLLISTHILKEVSEMCGSVTMINHGRTIITGDVAQLIHDSAVRDAGKIMVELRTLKQITPAFIKDIEGCTGVKSTESQGDHQLKVMFSGTEEDEAHLIDIVYAHDLRLLGMKEDGADLESMYMELTKDSEVNVR
jgi:ABC-2 type transport system ATP-binding protein